MADPSKRCPHSTSCEMYRALKIHASLRVWQVFYCETSDRHRECERYKRAARGEVVPPDLLPSGARISSSAAGGGD